MASPAERSPSQPAAMPPLEAEAATLPTDSTLPFPSRTTPPHLTTSTVPLKGNEEDAPVPKRLSWRSFVPSLANLPGILLALSTVAGFILFMVLGKYLAGPLTHLSDFVKARGVWGYVIMAGLVMIASFPPIVGYGILLVVNGYIFGVWKGWLISWCAALVGAGASFLLCRYAFRDYVYKKAAKHPYFAALCHTLAPPMSRKRRLTDLAPLLHPDGSIASSHSSTSTLSQRMILPGDPASEPPFTSEPDLTLPRSNPADPVLITPLTAAETTKAQVSSFFLVVLIRLAPFPFNLFNLILSSTPLSLKRFLLATAIANVKIVLDVTIGASVSNISEIVNDPGLPPNQKKQWIKVVPIAVAVILATLAIVVVGYFVRKRLRLIQAALDAGHHALEESSSEHRRSSASFASLPPTSAYSMDEHPRQEGDIRVVVHSKAGEPDPFGIVSPAKAASAISHAVEAQTHHAPVMRTLGQRHRAETFEHSSMGTLDANNFRSSSSS